MVWEVVGEVAVGYQWAVIPTAIYGDVALRVVHSYGTYGAFPGKAYALISSLSPAGDREIYHRSYPYGDEPDVIVSEIPAPLIAVGFGERYLSVKHDLYARFQADANWRVTISQWVTPA